MNPITQLRDDLHVRFPGIALEADAPGDPSGRWFLDVRPGGAARWIVVEWQQDLGFGVSTPGEADFGTKPDEIHPDADRAFERVAELITSGGATQPPTPAELAQLRRAEPLERPSRVG